MWETDANLESSITISEGIEKMSTSWWREQGKNYSNTSSQIFTKEWTLVFNVTDLYITVY